MSVRQSMMTWPRRVLIAAVRAYRFFLKPWLGNACRFEPTCSAYALQALERHGALAGTTLSVGRVLRCHPWCDGGCDPVPDHPPRLFTSLGLVAGTAPGVRPASSPDPDRAADAALRKPAP